MKTRSFLLRILSPAVLAGCATSYPPKQLDPVGLASTPRARALRQVEQGRTVRLFPAAAAHIQGSFVEAAGDSVALQISGRVVSVTLAGIDSAWVRVNGTEAGAMIGGSITAVAGAVFLGYVAASLGGSGAEAVLAGAALGGMAGTVLGAGLGAIASHWRPVFGTAARIQSVTAAQSGGRGAALVGLRQGSRLRVYRQGVPAAQGQLVRATPDSVMIQSGGAASVWRLAEVDSITVHVNRDLKGALIGGVTIGLVSALAMGSFASGMCEAADCDDAWRDGALGGALLGFAVGSGAGAIAGSAASGWRRAYP